MSFFHTIHRTFTYVPRFYKPEEDGERKIRFERKTLFDPRGGGLGLTRLIVFLAIIALLIGYILPKLSAVSVEDTTLSREDAVITEINITN